MQACRAGFVLLSSSRVYSIPPLASFPWNPWTTLIGSIATQDLPPGVTADGVTEKFSTEPPVSLYGGTKLASECLALEYGAAFGFPVWVNRCGVLAGAGQFGTAEQGIFSYWMHAHARAIAASLHRVRGTGLPGARCISSGGPRRSS